MIGGSPPIDATIYRTSLYRLSIAYTLVSIESDRFVTSDPCHKGTEGGIRRQESNHSDSPTTGLNYHRTTATIRWHVQTSPPCRRTRQLSRPGRPLCVDQRILHSHARPLPAGLPLALA